MGGVGEHIHHTCAHQSIAVAHHYACVARQGGRVAGDIDYLLCPEGREVLADLLGTGTGRINKNLVEPLDRKSVV